MDNFGLADLGYVILGILIVGIGLPLAWGFVQQKLEQRRVVSTGHTIVVQKPVQSVQKLPQPTTIIQQSVPTMREGRKCRMWIVLATQDAQVETLGLKSGVRNTFHIRLVGNVEAATWSALIGVGIPKPTQRLEHGYWHLAGRQSGIAHIVRPTIFDIQRIAQQTPHMYNPLVTCADETTEPIVNDKPINELTLVKQWLEADPSLSRRETARRLYKVRGGTDTEYSGDGPLYYEAVELYNKARESVDQSTFIGAT
jgi:hypothetical protein